jgi:hypothetical protein
MRNFFGLREVDLSPSAADNWGYMNMGGGAQRARGQ